MRGAGRDRDAREAGRGGPREAGQLARRRRAAPSREGEADAVVSAGNTGAMLAAGLLELRRLPGVLRPAIAVPIPARNGPSVLIDAGANADAAPEHLLQFATMGAVFAEEILDIARTRRCGCSRSARSRRRGTSSRSRRTSCSPRATSTSRGNAEGRDLLAGAADVVVTDGFTGNVALKLLEGTIRTLLDALREEITATRDGQARRPAHPARRPGGCATGSIPDTYGGAYLLGLRGLAVIAHGNSSRTAIANADPPRGPRRRARRRRQARSTASPQRAEVV